MLATSAHEHSRGRRWWPIALILAATLAAYAPALRAGFIWDDDQYLTENPTLRDLAGLGDIWLAPGATPQYYPLTFTSFWIEYHLWGLHPLGYHAVNILLHAANAALLWMILEQLGMGRAALLAAMIFALHPVHAESVAWISERKNTLSGLFYLAAGLMYLRFAGMTGGKARGAENHCYWLSLAFFACAVLSKTVTSTLPLALVIVMWWKRRRVTLAALLPLAPMIALGLGMGFVTAKMERVLVMAEGAEWDFSPPQRVLIASRAIVFYAAKMIWPARLSFNYERWHIDPHQPSQYLYIVLLTGAWIALWVARHRLGRGPLAAAAFFVVSLLPALGFVNVYPMRYSFVADHFQYLASIGIITLIAAMIARGGSIVALPLIVLLAILTASRAKVFQFSQRLWLDTIAKNPSSWLAYNNLAADDERAGRVSVALERYRKAHELNGNDYKLPLNIGNLLAAVGRYDEAEPWLREAVAKRPDDVESHYRLAMSLAAEERYREALAEYLESYRLHAIQQGTAAQILAPNLTDAAAYVAAGQAQQSAGNAPAAIANYLKALELNPQNNAARIQLKELFSFSPIKDQSGSTGTRPSDS